MYKTTNSGGELEPLAGGIQTRDVRAVAADGMNVYAATKDGDILRSTDGGTSWNVVANEIDIGETSKAIVIDRLTPTALYAADFEFAGKLASDSFIIKSTNSGATWLPVHESLDPPSAEMRAYTLSVDPIPAGICTGWNGRANLGKSGDGGTTWKAIQAATGFVYGMAADSR